jgi:hypothetical protein
MSSGDRIPLKASLKVFKGSNRSRRPMEARNQLLSKEHLHIPRIPAFGYGLTQCKNLRLRLEGEQV